MKELQSFKYAIRGVLLFLKEKGHARFHLFASLIAIGLSIYLKINLHDWLWIITAMTLVLISEMINSAIEGLIDHIHPGKAREIGDIKDRLAGMVLTASLVSIIIGIVVWGPYLTELK